MQIGHAQQRDVELGIEQDRRRVVRPGWAVHADRPTAGDDVGVGQDVPGRDHEPAAGRLEAARARLDLQRARLGHGRDRPRLRIIGPLDGRSRERLEPDEHVGEPRRVQQAPECERQLGRGRQGCIEGPDDRRGLGCLGEAGHRADREQPTGQPQHQDCLGAGDQSAAQPVDAAEDAAPHPRAQPRADRRSDRLADDDRSEQADQDEERPDRRVDIGERLLQ